MKSGIDSNDGPLFGTCQVQKPADGRHGLQRPVKSAKLQENMIYI